MKTIPPPQDLYSNREHPEEKKHSDDDDDDKYAGTGLTKEDKMKLLEIAKKNALNVHGGLNKNESIAMRAGGLTIEQLTAKAARIQSGKDDPISEDIPDDMLNHPFAVEEKAPEQLTFRPGFNIYDQMNMDSDHFNDGLDLFIFYFEPVLDQFSSSPSKPILSLCQLMLPWRN